MKTSKAKTPGTALVVHTPKKTIAQQIRDLYAADDKRSPKEIADALGCNVSLVYQARIALRKAKTGVVVALKGRTRRVDDGMIVESVIQHDGLPVLMLKGSPEMHGLVFSDVVAKIRKAAGR